MKTAFGILLALALGIAVLAIGCNGKKDSGEGSAASTETSVRTTEEYRQDAERQITKDNAEAELRKLEGEINADAE